MPYPSIKEIPEHIKKYSGKIQSQWRHVFNSTWKKLETEEVSKKVREERSFRAANSILKKRFTKKDSMEKNSRHDFFQHNVERWLGNLRG